MTRKHNENEVLSLLRLKHDVRVTLQKEVLILNGKSGKGQFQRMHDLGNGTWGKIDFLVSHCGYKMAFVPEW